MIESDTTKLFFELTPERVLDAVEAGGVRCTGRCLTLNSMENRVYEVELDIDLAEGQDSAEKFRVVKFYRPGRWSKEQLLEEHQFMADLAAREVPAVAPIPFPDGSTLRLMPGVDIWYTVFPKVRGRGPDELTTEQLEWMGRLLGRLHQVGGMQDAPHRWRINPEQYLTRNLASLVASKAIPSDLIGEYQRCTEQLCTLVTPLFDGIATQRIHGDCHQGNILWNKNGPFFLDFDDMVVGPAVQDLWLVVPGRDQESRIQMDILLEGYEQMRHFDRRELRLVEPLRAMRYVHFSAWIAKRWEDPYFKRVFTQFGTAAYWQTQITDLKEQIMLIEAGATPAPY